MRQNSSPDIIGAGGSFAAALLKTLLNDYPERTGHLCVHKKEYCSEGIQDDTTSVFNVAALFPKQIEDNTKKFTEANCDLPPNLTCSTLDDFRFEPKKQTGFMRKKESGLLILAYPVQKTRPAFKDLLIAQPQILENRDILLVSKGIEKETLRTPCQIAEEVITELGLMTEKIRKRIAYLIGPNLAWELMLLQLMIANIGGEKAAVKRISRYFRDTNLTIRQTRARLGLEISGALKNSLAISLGLAKGLELAGYNIGNSSQASFSSICLAEEERFVYAADKKAKKEQALLYGPRGDSLLAYDYRITRNYRAGVELVKHYNEYYNGKTLSELMDDQVIEGEHSARPLLQIAEQMKVKMPILSLIADVLERKLTPEGALDKISELSRRWADAQEQGFWARRSQKFKKYFRAA